MGSCSFDCANGDNRILLNAGCGMTMPAALLNCIGHSCQHHSA